MSKLNSKFHLLTTPLFIVLLNTPCVSNASEGTLQFSQPTFNVCDSTKPTVVVIEVSREGGSEGKVSVKYATAAGTATVDKDYKEKTGELVWEDGDATAKTFEVEIIKDQKFNEGYETVSLTLTEPTGGASLGTQSESTLGIVDTCLQFSQPTFKVHENDSSNVAVIEVIREGGSNGKVSVKYTTADGTATAGSDYKEQTGELVWEDGDATAKTFEVEIINDEEFNEGYETVSLKLTEPTGDASLGTQSESTLKIADDDCGTNDPDAPNAHWVDTCPRGNDAFSTEATVNIAFGFTENPIAGKKDCSQQDANGVYEVTLHGPAKAFRMDGTDHSIKTEMYNMELTGTTPLGKVVMRAGDGIANRQNDGLLYSPGRVDEQADDPTKADSFFDILFELETPIGILHNKKPFKMSAIGLLGVPPIQLKRKDGTFYTVTYLHPIAKSHIVLKLFDKNDQAAACFKVKEIGIPAVKHIPQDPFPPDDSDDGPDLAVLDSFTALTRNGQISIAWETVAEENNAAFRVWRGMPLSGICSENPDDYTEVTQVTPLISSKGTKVSGATYTDVIDKNVVRGVTYCYALEDIDHDGKSTFHMDKIVPVTAD